MFAKSGKTLWLTTDKGIISYCNDSVKYYYIDTNDTNEKSKLSNVQKNDKYSGNNYKQFDKVYASENKVYLIMQNHNSNRIYIAIIENENISKYKYDIERDYIYESAIISGDRLIIELANYVKDIKKLEHRIYILENELLKEFTSYYDDGDNKLIAYYNEQLFLMTRDEYRTKEILKLYFLIYKITPVEKILLKSYNDDSCDFMFWNYYQEGKNIYFMNFEGALRKFDLENFNDSLMCELNEELTVSVPFFINNNKLFYTKGNLIQNIMDLNNNTREQFNLDEDEKCPYYITDYLVLKQNNEVYCLCLLWGYKKGCRQSIIKCFKIKE
jgi:hypothetical protein